MVRLDHVIAGVFQKSDGTSIGCFRLPASLVPAWEAARLSAASLGLWPVQGDFVPVWNDSVGQPAIAGFLLRLFDENQRQIGTERFPLAYFNSYVRALAPAVRKHAGLPENEEIHFAVVCFKDEAAETPRLQLIPDSRRWPLKDSSLTALLERTFPMGDVLPDDIPVVVHSTVLDQIAAMAAASADETGGVCVGHLHWDKEARQIAVEVVRQIPLEHTVASSARLTLTPDTFTAAVQAVENLPGEPQMVVGLWHSHPVKHWKASVADEARNGESEEVEMTGNFYSADDLVLHRTVLPAAYSVSLVAAAGEQVEFSMYSAARGVIRGRGFHVRKED